MYAWSISLDFASPAHRREKDHTCSTATPAFFPQPTTHERAQRASHTLSFYQRSDSSPSPPSPQPRSPRKPPPASPPNAPPKSKTDSASTPTSLATLTSPGTAGGGPACSTPASTGYASASMRTA